jgi:divalent metal cation (Fe/Co/Zn/Cd) transporter
MMGKDQKVALLAIGVNLVLFGLKYLFAGLSGSMALKAEAIHSLSDVIASSTVFAGLIIAKRKTRSFPYGLYKVENLVSVVVALAILGVRVLLDASLDYQTLSMAEKLILGEPRVIEIKNLMGRNSGRYKFIEANIVL